MVPPPISFYPFEKTKKWWEFAISWNFFNFIMCFSYMNGFYWRENVAFSFLFQQCLIVKPYNRFQHKCFSVCLPPFLLNSSLRIFGFDSVQSSSIKYVVERKLKKQKKKKKVKKLLFFRNNEQFIRRKEQTVTHTHTQQHLLTPTTDHCSLLNSFGLNYFPVVSCWHSFRNNRNTLENGEYNDKSFRNKS